MLWVKCSSWTNTRLSFMFHKRTASFKPYAPLSNSYTYSIGFLAQSEKRGSSSESISQISESGENAHGALSWPAALSSSKLKPWRNAVEISIEWMVKHINEATIAI